MKQIFLFLGAAIVLFSCKSGSTGSPKSTVESFIEASKQADLTEIKKYISKSDLSLLEMAEGFMSKMDTARAREMKDKMTQKFREKSKDAKYNVKDEKIDGDNATVNVEFTHDGQTETHPFSLVKEDGQWKISLVSTGMSGMGADSKQSVQDALKSVNLDSLKGAVSQQVQEGMKDINSDSLQRVVNEAMKDVDKTTGDSIKKAMKEGLKELQKLKELHKN